MIIYVCIQVILNRVISIMKTMLNHNQSHPIIGYIQNLLVSQTNFSQKYQQVVKKLMLCQASIKMEVINKMYNVLGNNQQNDAFISKLLTLKLIKIIMLKGSFQIYMMIIIKVLPCLIAIGNIKQQNNHKNHANTSSNIQPKYQNQQLSFFKTQQRNYKVETIKLAEQILLFFGGVWPNANKFHPYSAIKFQNIFLRAIIRIPRLNQTYNIFKNQKMLKYNFKFFRGGDYQSYVNNLYNVVTNKQYKQFGDYLTQQIDGLVKSNSYRCFISEYAMRSLYQKFDQKIDLLRRVIYTADSYSIKVIIKQLARSLNYYYHKLIQGNANDVVDFLARICHIIQIIDFIIKVCEIQTVEEIKINCIEIIIKILVVDYDCYKFINLQKVDELTSYIIYKLQIWSQCTKLVDLSTMLYRRILELIASFSIEKSEKIQQQIQECIRNLRNLKEINNDKKKYLIKEGFDGLTVNIESLLRKLKNKSFKGKYKSNNPSQRNLTDKLYFDQTQNWVNGSSISLKISSNKNQQKISSFQEISLKNNTQSKFNSFKTINLSASKSQNSQSLDFYQKKAYNSHQNNKYIIKVSPINVQSFQLIQQAKRNNKFIFKNNQKKQEENPNLQYYGRKKIIECKIPKNTTKTSKKGSHQQKKSNSNSKIRKIKQSSVKSFKEIQLSKLNDCQQGPFEYIKEVAMNQIKKQEQEDIIMNSYFKINLPKDMELPLRKDRIKNYREDSEQEVICLEREKNENQNENEKNIEIPVLEGKPRFGFKQSQSLNRFPIIKLSLCKKNK